MTLFLFTACAQKPEDAVRPRRTTLTNGKSWTVKAGGNLQAALNAAQYGDTIILQAGATFKAPSAGQAFMLPAKSGGTGSDADYITVQSSAVASLPAGRVTAADKVNMAKIAAVGPGGCIAPGMNSKYWKFVGIEFTNISDGSEGSRVGRLINQNTPQGSTDAPEKWGDHFLFDRCYFHPQEDGSTNYDRSAEVAVGWNGGAITITRSRFSGFGGVHGGQAIPSGCFWSNYGGPYVLDDNYMAATFNPIFLGAGENGSPNQATIGAGATLTQATLSNVSNLQAGDKIALEVHLPSVGGYDTWLYGVTANGATDTLSYNGHGFNNDDACYVDNYAEPASGVGLKDRGTWQVYYVINKTASTFQLSLSPGGSAVDLTGSTSGGGIKVGANGHKYINAVITSVNASTKAITYNTAVRWEGDRRPDAIYPYQYVVSSEKPLAGGKAVWKGYQVHDFTFTHNTIDIDYTTAVYVKQQTGSNAKGFMEVKNLVRGLIEGNVFTGYPTSLVFTNASQNSTSPWVSVRDITVRSNIYQSFSTMLIVQLISGTMSDEGSNIQFLNNLGYNIYDVNAVLGQAPVMFYTSGGTLTPLVARHNTVINKPTQDGASAWLGILPMPNPNDDKGIGITFEDNIIYYGKYGVTTNGKPWNTYFPHFVERKNVWIDDAGKTGSEYITGQYGQFPKSYYAKSDAMVRFVDPSKHNYRLAENSPYRNKASDGTDVGVDMDALQLAVGNNPEKQ